MRSILYFLVIVFALVVLSALITGCGDSKSGTGGAAYNVTPPAHYYV
jgi:hypothetical protein